MTVESYCYYFLLSVDLLWILYKKTTHKLGQTPIQHSVIFAYTYSTTLNLGFRGSLEKRLSVTEEAIHSPESAQVEQ